MTDPTIPGGAHVELKDVSKSFGGARALEAVSVRIRRGSIHALVGENGAGKSTLGKIISGDLAPDQGQLLVDGAVAHFHSPRAAHGERHRPDRPGTVYRARAVGRGERVPGRRAPPGLLRRRELRSRYAELAGRTGFDLEGEANAGSLRTAGQQKTEILRALNREAKLIVMDEPTAALSRPDVAALHDIIRRLARAGTTIVLVSHFLGEVLELADDITILRDGRVAASSPAAGQTEETLLNAMLGRTLGAIFPVRQPAAADAPAVLSVSALSAPGVAEVSLEIRRGEIVGLAGLIGSGRSELARAIALAVRPTAGTVAVSAQHQLPTGRSRWGIAGRGTVSPRQALRAGIAMIPESRKDDGLMLLRSVAENVSLSSLEQLSRHGLVRRGAERTAVRRMLGELDVRAPGESVAAGSLSGGNQQKLLFARTLLAAPRVLIADEPTRGVDVGAKRAIYELLTSLAARGLGILMISSDLEEVLGLAHRVLVMRGGRIVAELDGETATEASVLGAAFGSAERGA